MLHIGCDLPAALLADLDQYIAYGELLSDQVRRRILYGERIPHEEKIFSIFEPHTEWINKGKAGVPVELGLRVAVCEGLDHKSAHPLGRASIINLPTTTMDNCT